MCEGVFSFSITCRETLFSKEEMILCALVRVNEIFPSSAVDLPYICRKLARSISPQNVCGNLLYN